MSFYGYGLDKVYAPITYSEQVQLLMSPGYTQENLNQVSLGWEYGQLPTLRSAFNTLDLIKKSRLIMLIWASGHEDLHQEMLIG